MTICPFNLYFPIFIGFNIRITLNNLVINNTKYILVKLFTNYIIVFIWVENYNKSHDLGRICVAWRCHLIKKD